MGKQNSEKSDATKLVKDKDTWRFDERVDGKACTFCGDDKRHFHPASTFPQST